MSPYVLGPCRLDGALRHVWTRRTCAKSFRAIRNALPRSCTLRWVRGELHGRRCPLHSGYPRAHEGRRRAGGTSGVELKKAVSALKSPAFLRTRIGMATGLVADRRLIGSGDAQEPGIVGERRTSRPGCKGSPSRTRSSSAKGRGGLLGNLFDWGTWARGPQGYRRTDAGVGGLRTSSAEGRFEAMHGTDLTALVGREEQSELLRRAGSKRRG